MNWLLFSLKSLQTVEREYLPTTMTQGLITLIPKSNEDTLIIDDWHPVCFLNNDYKIFALILAKRLKLVMDSMIDTTGFKNSKRHTVNNVRLVLDNLDYLELFEEDGLILFLDLYKAFDTVELQVNLQSLKKFGCGHYFSTAIKTIKMVIVLLNRCLVHLIIIRFNLWRGVRQGCPASQISLPDCSPALSGPR